MAVREVTPESINPYSDSLSGRFSRVLDDAILMVAPTWGARRKNARLRSALTAAKVERLGVSWTRSNDNRDAKWIETGYSIDHILNYDLEELHDRCSELYRTNNIAHAAVEGRVAHEVSSGIRPRSRVSDKVGESRAELARQALDEVFADWSENGVDEKRSIDFFELEKLATRSMAVYGEVLIVMSDMKSTSDVTLACEVVSPERLSTPPEKMNDRNCRLGVQFSDSGQVLGYWIRSTHPGAEGKDYEYSWDYYPIRDVAGQRQVIHAFERLFPGQTRGIPWLASALDRIKDLDDWHEAELIAKQVEACFGLIITQGAGGQSPYEAAQSHLYDTTSDGRQLEEVSPGMIHYARDGEEVHTVDPSRPGATFAPFVESSLRSIAAALNFPYEILAKNFFRTTFSSGQLAMLDGRLGFKARRQQLVDGVLVPIWNRFVHAAVFANEARGTIDITQFTADPKPWTKSIWVPPGVGFVNPRDEVRAGAEALKNDMTTLATLYSQQGEDAEVQLQVRREERLQATRDEVERRRTQWELEEQYGLPHAEAAMESEDDDDDDSSGSDAKEEKEEAPA